MITVVGMEKGPIIKLRLAVTLLTLIWATTPGSTSQSCVKVQQPDPGKYSAAEHKLVEWLARQPWSTGKVGTWGLSYMGWAALIVTL